MSRNAYERVQLAADGAGKHVAEALVGAAALLRGDRSRAGTIARDLAAASEATDGASMVAAKSGAPVTGSLLAHTGNQLQQMAIVALVPTGAAGHGPGQEQAIVNQVAPALLQVQQALGEAPKAARKEAEAVEHMRIANPIESLRAAAAMLTRGPDSLAAPDGAQPRL